MSAHKALIVLLVCALLGTVDKHAKPDAVIVHSARDLGAPSPAPASGTTAAAGPGADDSPYKFGVRTDLVNVIFTVTDKHGRFIKDLKQSDIKILDNNLPPKQVMNFEAETDLPLRVGLVD